MNNFESFYSSENCNIKEFEKLIKQEINSNLLNCAEEIINNVPVYNMEVLRDNLHDKDQRLSLMSEWAYVLSKASGALVLKNTYSDCSSIDLATKIYENIILEEKEKNIGGSDHYAKPGANDRIWNSLQKLCEKDSFVFAKYFGNEIISSVCWYIEISDSKSVIRL